MSFLEAAHAEVVEQLVAVAARQEQLVESVTVEVDPLGVEHAGADL